MVKSVSDLGRQSLKLVIVVLQDVIMNVILNDIFIAKLNTVEPNGESSRDDRFNRAVQTGKVKLLLIQLPRQHAELNLVLIALILNEADNAERTAVAFERVGHDRAGIGAAFSGIGNAVLEHILDIFGDLVIRLHLMRHSGDSVRNAGAPELVVKLRDILIHRTGGLRSLVFLGVFPHLGKPESRSCDQDDRVYTHAYPIHMGVLFLSSGHLTHLAIT